MRQGLTCAQSFLNRAGRCARPDRSPNPTTAPAMAAPPGPASPTPPPPPSFAVKRVRAFGRDGVPIVLQNENGPCPLLAIANCLLLRGAVELPAGARSVSQASGVAGVGRAGRRRPLGDPHARAAPPLQPQPLRTASSSW